MGQRRALELATPRPRPPPPRRALAALLPSLVAPWSPLSCATYGGHLSAKPTSVGGREVSLVADALVVDRGLGLQVLPNPELGLRYGVARGVDLGGRLNVGSIEVNARLRALEAGRARLTLVPGLGFGFVPVTNSDSGVMNASALAAALAGLGVGARSELVFGARIVTTYAFPLTALRGDAEGAKVLHAPGLVVGLRAPVGARKYLFPELNVLLPRDTARDAWRLPTLQGGLALQFE